MIVETCKEPASPASSCHSHHTTITLHHSLPSSPIPKPTSPCMSASSHEDVFESDPEKPLSSQNSMKSEPDGHLNYKRKRKEANSNFTSNQIPLGAGLSHQSLASSRPLSEEDLIQLSPEKGNQTPRKESNEPEQPNKSHQATDHEHVGGQASVSSQESGMSIQAAGSGLPTGSSISNPTAADNNRVSGSIRGQLSDSTPVTPHQMATRSHSNPAKNISHKGKGTSSSSTTNTMSSSSSNSRNKMTFHQDNLMKDGQHHINFRVSGKANTQTKTHGQLNLSLPSHPEQSCSATSSCDHSTHSKSHKLQNETPATNTELLAETHQSDNRNTHNTEELLFKVKQERKCLELGNS